MIAIRDRTPVVPPADYDCRRSDAPFSKRSRDTRGVAHLPKDRRRISPKDAPLCKLSYGSGVILEVGQIDDRVALDVPRHTRRGGRAERHTKISLKREAARARMVIAVPKRVDRCHRAAGPYS
jgi:hypothetical protein